ncbi:hypothetical protein CH063_02953 [Colletotrichum higginsianum]|uniref:Uncharacterized protein n=1 Tax=Colletotrichum higginsianum (strain IMI 349063) TaxID=759273 RepID=H1VRQ1_COLHI|nr:hypothetical protein CH063_02953 [Colletotrichum higginsianum]
MQMPTWRKWVTLAVVCWMALPVTFSGSSILSATTEVAADFGTTILGRRTTYLVANALLTLCSVGSALAGSFALFTAIWVIGGTTGPVLPRGGQTILADISSR